MALSSDRLVPEGFLFGVATAGFQVEGGYNGPGEPANNWEAWEREGRVDISGSATGFFDDPVPHLDAAEEMGLTSFRLSLEWARLEPTPGSFSREALLAYRSILEGIRRRGMEPVVSLSHFTHPAWLGSDPWRSEESADRLVSWMARAVRDVGDLCSRWVTVNEPNILCVNTFLTGLFPPGRLGDTQGFATSFDTLISAHVGGYDAIHDAQPDAIVTTNPYTLSIYELDQVVTDLLTAADQGVTLPDVSAYLVEARRRHYRRIGDGGAGAPGAIERLLRRLCAARFSVVDTFPRTRAALARSERTTHLDVIAVDHYAPLASAHLIVPGRATPGGRWWHPTRALWDDGPDLDTFSMVLDEAGSYARPVWVLENGMASRTVRSRAFGRMDAARRPAYLAEHLQAVVDAIARGVDVRGYWHWTLVDNYEWGSFEPRFGLHTMDRARGMTISPLDALGDDASGAYRIMIEGLTRGDPSVFRPFRLGEHPTS